MSDSTLWWVAAGVLTAAELLTGTFYLLMIAIGLAAAAVAAHLGLGTVWQWVTAALIGSGSILILQLAKKSEPPSNPASSNPNVNLDIGELVQVANFNEDGTCAVQYRGTQWAAALAPGERAQAGTCQIVEVIGNRLILKPTNTLNSGV